MKTKRIRKSITLSRIFREAALNFVERHELLGYPYNELTIGCCGRIERVLLDICVYGQIRNEVAAKFGDLFYNASYFPYYWPGCSYEERLFALLLAAEFYKGKRVYYYVDV